MFSFLSFYNENLLYLRFMIMQKRIDLLEVLTKMYCDWETSTIGEIKRIFNSCSLVRNSMNYFLQHFVFCTASSSFILYMQKSFAFRFFIIKIQLQNVQFFRFVRAIEFYFVFILCTSFFFLLHTQFFCACMLINY